VKTPPRQTGDVQANMRSLDIKLTENLEKLATSQNMTSKENALIKAGLLTSTDEPGKLEETGDDVAWGTIAPIGTTQDGSRSRWYERYHVCIEHKVTERKRTDEII
jgi:hypothetical protein